MSSHRTALHAQLLVALASVASSYLLPWEPPAVEQRLSLYRGSLPSDLVTTTREWPEVAALRFVRNVSSDHADLDHELYQLSATLRAGRGRAEPGNAALAAAPFARVGVRLRAGEKWLSEHGNESPEEAVFNFLLRQDLFQYATTSSMQTLATGLRSTTVVPNIYATTQSAVGRRLTRMVIVPDVAESLDTCPVTLRQRLHAYAAWHKKECAKLDAGRVDVARAVVFACGDQDDCNGLADRLTGFASVFVFALKHGLLFFSRWRAFNLWMESPLIDYRINASWPIAHLLDATPPPPGWLRNCKHDPSPACGGLPCRCIWQHSDPYTFFVQLADAKGAAPNGSFPNPVLIATNRGVFAAMAPSELFQVSNAIGHDMGCVYWALFRPTPALQARAAGHVARARLDGSLGIHARFGDAMMAGQRSATVSASHRQILRQLRSCTARDRTMSLFVLSDDSSFVRRVLSVYPNAWTTGETPQHINPADMTRLGNPLLAARLNITEALGAALTDWLVLSECERLLVTPQPGLSSSGFARTAMAYSRTQRLPPSRSTLVSSPSCPLIDDMNMMVMQFAWHGAGL